MDFNLTPEEEAFKQEFTDWLDKNIPEGFLNPGYPLPDEWDERADIYRKFQRKLFDAGYAGITYPKEYGGRGGTFMENIIVTEALAPWTIKSGDVNMVGVGMAGNTIMTCGTEEQKEYFIPRLLNGDHIWCQGFSEPDAGSDLGNVATSAIWDGDDYVVNGQKVWTSFAHISNYCLLLARSNPELSKHKGMSFFLVDMKLPGIDVRPLMQMTDEAEFNEVYFNDVRVPKSMRIGKEGDGWRVVLTTLMYERVMGDVNMVSQFWWEYEKIVEMARKVIRNGRPATQDPIIRQKLAQCYIDLTVLRNIGYRSVSRIAKGEVPGPEGSIGKLYWSEFYQKMTELAMEIQGPYHQLKAGSPRVIDNAYWQHEFLYSKAHTIAGGTSEVQRNIIGERVLRLPKDL
jgi:alkylation response protein AidB-like acyl-CoA dehydrogenase